LLRSLLAPVSGRFNFVYRWDLSFFSLSWFLSSSAVVLSWTNLRTSHVYLHLLIENECFYKSVFMGLVWNTVIYISWVQIHNKTQCKRSKSK
jgi:hypothetical protein